MRTSSDSASLTAIYKFAIFTVLFFWSLVFTYPMTTELHQDAMFYLNAIAAALCILLLLVDVWVPDNINKQKIRGYLWYPMLSLSLPFISTFAFVRTGYDFYWGVNFVFANALLWLTLGTSLVLGLTLVIGIVGGAAFGLTLNLDTPLLDAALFEGFALYSFVFLLARIALVIRDRVSVKAPIEASE